MKTIVKNRKAFHDYLIEDKYEAGLVLTGSEIKSLRAGHGSLAEGFAQVINGEVWLLDTYIPPFKQASYNNHEEKRKRKLLFHRHEIRRLFDVSRRAGYTLVPLELYFNNKNIVKLRLGVGRGKNKGDKRESAKAADAKREAQRAMKR